MKKGLATDYSWFIFMTKRNIFLPETNTISSENPYVSDCALQN